MDTTQPQEIYRLEKYGEDTASALLYLMLQSAGVSCLRCGHTSGISCGCASVAGHGAISSDDTVCRAASHIGNATGLTLLLNGATKYASAQTCPLPETLMTLHGVEPDDFHRMDTEQPMRDVFYDVAGNAAVHLEHARSLCVQVSIRPKLARRSRAAAVLHRLRHRFQASTSRACCQPRCLKII